MTTLKDDVNISEERYIEIKKLAYKYYEEYKKLDSYSRKQFLKTLPMLSLQFENNILINTLVLPDTEYLVNVKKDKLISTLSQIAKNQDDITDINITAKLIEYSKFNTKELIQNGKLKIMDEINYDNCINVKEYKELKNSTIDFMQEFYELPLRKKVKLINKACKTETYQAQIQVATLLIPNDNVLMEQLKVSSVSDVADCYKVPESLINFKLEEYNRQKTELLIQDGSINKVKYNRVWYKDLFDDSIIDRLTNQSFYQSIENNHISTVNDTLEVMFKEYSKNSTNQKNIK